MAANDENRPKVLTPDQKLFVVLSKEKGIKTPQIQTEFNRKWPESTAPSRRTIFNLSRVLNKHKNLLDQRSVSSGGGKTVRIQENIDAVKEVLENEMHRTPDQPGSTCRRNPLQLSKSSFHRIIKKDLGWKPYKIVRRQKLTADNVLMRVQMGRYLSTKPMSYFESLIVSDEAWFTLGGHVMNRQNNVLYSPPGNGALDQWFTEAKQSHEKVMVFCLLSGGGEKFGPFFLPKDKTVDSHAYKWLLAHKVIPLIKRQLGQDRFQQAIWQQDGAKAHQANIVMDWLDGIFGDRMLALKARQGYFWSPSSPDMNPCDFFLWGVLKDKVYQPMPVTMNDLKQKIEEVFNDIPKETVKKAVVSMRSRAAKLVAVEGKGFEGKRIRI